MIYVDDMKASFGRMTMCHLCSIPHNNDALIAFAKLIGVKEQCCKNKLHDKT